MPRQPLADTPGLPPYGQRSSERRKEQNRLAQRQLRERRQQQEAAQALKLQQQQNEIRRLNRIITELRNENFNLKNQSAFRRRQSVIPISSISRGLVMNHVPSSMSGGNGVDSNSKPSLFARHSIDYSSLQGACISSSSDTSHRLHEQLALQDAYNEDEYAINYISNFREPIVNKSTTTLQPTRLPYDNPFCRRNLAPQTCAFQDRSIQVNSDKEKVAVANKKYGGEGSSPMTSTMSARKPMTNSTWLSASRNTTPTAAELPENTCVTSPQKLEISPERDTTSSKGEIMLPSINLASFWPARPPSPSPPNDLGSGTDVDPFSDSQRNYSVVPADFFSASNPLFSNNRMQTRKTSASAESDSSSSSTTNSILPNSDSSVNTNSIHFPFATPQEALSHYLTRSLSPTTETGSSPEIKNQEKKFTSEINNSSISFRSPFSEINKLEINENSTFNLPVSSWNETKKFSLETLSPFPTHVNSMCSIDVNDFWASDY